MSELTKLEPGILWYYFNEILQIPRPSKKEERIRNYLVEFAEKRGLSHKTDQAGNLLITKEATSGMENRKVVVLQSHLDMVGEKNSDVDHNFDTDPIQAYIDENWIRARNTTLGADDGIGIAAQMAILASDTIPHGKIECLFTVDEETGLTGAHALEEAFFEGKILLNLDSEDEGEIFIGCAGGIDTLAEFTYRHRYFPLNYLAFEITVSGLHGGHSGDEIHKSPGGNSNKLLGRFLWNASRKFGIRLSVFDGGNLRNAIPREASAVIGIDADVSEAFKDYFYAFEKMVKQELRYTEPLLELLLKDVDSPETIINRKTQERLLNSIYACPHGVYRWSQEMKGMVETSSNLASVKFKENRRILITTSQRSSVNSSREDIAARVASVFTLAKAKVWHSDGYPGWSPNPDSEIVKISEKTYPDLFGKKPVIRAIHAGLECGLFLEKYPELDMISFGPTIKGAHSPDERLEIDSTRKFWDFLLEMLLRIPVKN